MQESYIVVNARIGVRGPDNRWAVELWAQNLFDKDYQQVAFDAPFRQGSRHGCAVMRGFYLAIANQIGAFLAEPRTFGLTLRAQSSRHQGRRRRWAPPPPPPPPPAGDADLPRRPRDPGDRSLSACRRRRRRLPGTRTRLGV